MCLVYDLPTGSNYIARGLQLEKITFVIYIFFTTEILQQFLSYYSFDYNISKYLHST